MPIHEFDVFLLKNLATIHHLSFVEFFNSIDSMSWEPGSIIPLEVVDSDPTTGTLVHSTETRYYKDGTIWSADLMELFFIENSKISHVIQWKRGNSSEE